MRSKLDWVKSALKSVHMHISTTQIFAFWSFVCIRKLKIETLVDLQCELDHFFSSNCTRESKMEKGRRWWPFMEGGGGGRESPQIVLVGEFDLSLVAPTHFQTKICNFSYPISHPSHAVIFSVISISDLSIDSQKAPMVGAHSYISYFTE